MSNQHPFASGFGDDCAVCGRLAKDHTPQADKPISTHHQNGYPQADQVEQVKVPHHYDCSKYVTCEFSSLDPAIVAEHERTAYHATPTPPLAPGGEVEVSEIFRRYESYLACEEWHIHSSGDGFEQNADREDGHKDYDDIKAVADVMALFAARQQTAEEAYDRGYKQGVADEIECMETSGEHLAQRRADGGGNE